jgi:hypothetical protein
MSAITGCGVSGSNSVELAPSRPHLVARDLDRGDLHAEADAEVGHLRLARVLDCRDLALDAALAEAARDEDRVHVLQRLDAARLDRLGIHVVDVHARARLDARVDQRFGERLVRILQVHVLADHRDVDLVLGVLEAVDDVFPHREVGGVGREVELAADDLVQALLVQRHRDLVDRVHVVGEITERTSTLVKSAILRPLSSGSGFSERHITMSGWIRCRAAPSPSAGSGLVLISPTLARCGTSVRCM